METTMKPAQIEESMTNVFSLIDYGTISELKNLTGVDKKIWYCYSEIKQYIHYHIRDCRPLNINLDSWSEDYNLPAEIIKQILKKALNKDSLYHEYTDDDVEQYINKNSGLVNSII